MTPSLDLNLHSGCSTPPGSAESKAVEQRRNSEPRTPTGTEGKMKLYALSPVPSCDGIPTTSKNVSVSKVIEMEVDSSADNHSQYYFNL